MIIERRSFPQRAYRVKDRITEFTSRLTTILSCQTSLACWLPIDRTRVVPYLDGRRKS
jgi:hypothetical protein